MVYGRNLDNVFVCMLSIVMIEVWVYLYYAFDYTFNSKYVKWIFLYWNVDKGIEGGEVFEVFEDAVVLEKDYEEIDVDFFEGEFK